MIQGVNETTTLTSFYPPLRVQVAPTALAADGAQCNAAAIGHLLNARVPFASAPLILKSVQSSGDLSYHAQYFPEKSGT